MRTISKAAARVIGRSGRQALEGSVRAAADGSIVAHCQKSLEWEKYSYVHMFLPIAAQREINTWPLLEWLLEAHPGIEVYVPKIDQQQLCCVKVSSDTEYDLGPFAIPEPLAAKAPRKVPKLDVVLVPLLAVDRTGARVGYGGGFYDRFLDTQPKALKVGLAYTSAVLPDLINVGAHDVPVDGIVTPEGLVWLRQLA